MVVAGVETMGVRIVLQMELVEKVVVRTHQDGQVVG
jgi:hypothetical protein